MATEKKRASRDIIHQTLGRKRVAPPAPWRRRRAGMTAAAGIAVALGAGGLAVHSLQRHPADDGIRLAAVRSEPASPVSPSAAPSVMPSAGSPAALSASPSAATTGSASPPAGHGSAAAAPVRSQSHVRATPSTSTQVTYGSIVATVTDSGSMTSDHHTLRVVSAHGDLTGTGELAWAADDGQPVGDGHCTQNISVAPGVPPAIKPTLLICWRVSHEKTVYTVAVDVDHKPSAVDSVAVIDKTWSAMR